MSEKISKKEERESIIRSLRILGYPDEDINRSLKEHGYEGLRVPKQSGSLNEVIYTIIGKLTYVILGFVALGILVWAQLAPQKFTEYFPVMVIILTMAIAITITIRVFANASVKRTKQVTKNTWESDLIIGIVISLIVFFSAQHISLLMLIFVVAAPVFLILISAYKMVFLEAFPAALTIILIAMVFAHLQIDIMYLLVDTFSSLAKT